MGWRLRDRLLLLGGSAGIVLVLAACHGGPHLDVLVDTTADTADAIPGDGRCDDGTGACSLRAAIQEANAQAADVSVDITLPEGTYGLTGSDSENANQSGDLDVVGNVTITGSGVAVIDGQGVDRVFHVGPAGSLALRDVTITGGAANRGGGANVAGTLIASHVTFTGNVATQNGGGGGLRVNGDGVALLRDSTISGNTVIGSEGGGLTATTTGAVSVRFTTITENVGGGLYNGGSPVDVGASVVGDQASGADCAGVTPASSGYNVDSDSSCFSGVEPGDLAGADVGLGPLADNGGATHTHTPDPGSAVLNRVPPGTLSCGDAPDQRDAVRPKTGACEAGSVEVESADPGSYTLYSTQGSYRIDLLDDDGDQVHHWETDYPVINLPYLLPGGRVLYTHSDRPWQDLGGTIDVLDWEGNLEWTFTSLLLHHDVEPLPDGNLLLIGARDLSAVEAAALGRDPATAPDGLHLLDILEVDPTDTDGDPVVWDWYSGDHIVQDFDPLAPDYADPADHPELIDISWDGGVDAFDWSHANGIDYNAEHDQIAVSVRSFSEVWVIDHDTTTAEAASHSGGRQGRGGDLLYRWGNPATYRRGTAADQMLFVQHDPTWIPNDDSPGGYNLLVFNNGTDRPGGSYSSVDEIPLPVAADGSYPALAPGAAHGPTAPGWSWTAAPASDFYQMFMSGAQRLDDGNTFVAGAMTGELFEVTSGGAEVWRFDADPTVFKARRYEDVDGTEPTPVDNVP